jgi:(R,R)-butanediol dehydrogenase / meso-butanediol dehydrogenase / diacetyl reductase
MRMIAAVMHGAGDIRVEEVPRPSPGPGEVLLRITAVGVCGTDAAEFARGPITFPLARRHPVTGHLGPMIPGHELAGFVEGVGDGDHGLGEGALVASGAGISCGTCSWCRRGRTNLCPSYFTVGLDRHGGLAQYATVPAASCVEVDAAGLGPDLAALAQPMSIAVHAMRRGRPEPGDVAVVIGVGGIGAFLVHALASSGVTVVATDLDAERLKIATRLGAAHAIGDPGPGGLSDQLAAAQLAPTLVYEVTGTTAGLDAAFGVLRRGGRLVIVGHQKAAGEIAYQSMTRDELEVIGTNAHQCAVDLPEAIRLLSTRTDGWSDVAPIALPLGSLSATLEDLAAGRSGRIKTLIDPWASDPRPTRS